MFTQSTLIVGLGETGLAMARFLASKRDPLNAPAHLCVLDSREAPPGLGALQSEIENLPFVCASLASEQALSLLEDFDQVVWSPGLSPVHGESASLYQAAVAKGKTPLGELDLFAQALQELDASRGYRPKIAAITGTNGKTTTTMLTAYLLKQAGLDAVVAGNVSPAMLDVLRERLNSGVLPHAWILELSSFQLATSRSMRTDAACVLNVSQDHLDWHHDLADYAAAKSKIYDNAALCLFNRQDALTVPAKALSALDEYRHARKTRPRLSAGLAVPAPVISFGTDEPREIDCFGLVQGGGVSWLAERQSLSDDMEKAGEVPDSKLNRFMPADAMLLRGEHNHANALAAIALVKALGQRIGPVLHALGRYPGEPHRCELVSVVNDVEYIEDSKGTNVGASIAALHGLARKDGHKHLVLIAGGDGKGQDFAPLGLAIAHKVKALFVIGRDGGNIAQAAREAGATDIVIAQCTSLEQAVQQAAQVALTGDAVLLSPACASFDMFNNYKHRAQVFVDAVKGLAEQEGHSV
jgi:UDP-N-acetylmuramoylalanine--D-glutamate ligase